MRGMTASEYQMNHVKYFLRVAVGGEQGKLQIVANNFRRHHSCCWLQDLAATGPILCHSKESTSTWSLTLFLY